MSKHYQAERRVAEAAASAAADIIRRYYQSGIDVETKADRTPVTVADVEAELCIRKHLQDAFPDDGFFGEETGYQDAGSGRLWLVDPIDGTRSFVRGYPFFSTQIALMDAGELVVGVSSAPAFEELASAAKGAGVTLNGEACHVSDIGELADSAISTGNLRTLTQDPDRWQALGEIIGEVARNRGYGDFYHYHLLAAGRIEAVIESDVNILDIAALAVIVREAGGVFTDLDGGTPGLDTTTVLAANALQHAHLLARLRSSS